MYRREKLAKVLYREQGQVFAKPLSFGMLRHHKRQIEKIQKYLLQKKRIEEEEERKQFKELQRALAKSISMENTKEIELPTGATNETSMALKIPTSVESPPSSPTPCSSQTHSPGIVSSCDSASSFSYPMSSMLSSSPSNQTNSQFLSPASKFTLQVRDSPSSQRNLLLPSTASFSSNVSSSFNPHPLSPSQTDMLQELPKSKEAEEEPPQSAPPVMTNIKLSPMALSSPSSGASPHSLSLNNIPEAPHDPFASLPSFIYNYHFPPPAQPPEHLRIKEPPPEEGARQKVLQKVLACLNHNECVLTNDTQ